MIQKFFIRKASSLIFLIFFVISGFAPLQASAEATQFFGVRRNVATIIFCGLGGAVLGISTLSFYGDPQNHIGNITTGLALGIIGGSVYVTTRDTMPLDPVTEMRQKNFNRVSAPIPTLFSANWSF